jgi:altronate dehydratase
VFFSLHSVTVKCSIWEKDIKRGVWKEVHHLVMERRKPRGRKVHARQAGVSNDRPSKGNQGPWK